MTLSQMFKVILDNIIAYNDSHRSEPKMDLYVYKYDFWIFYLYWPPVKFSIPKPFVWLYLAFDLKVKTWKLMIYFSMPLILKPNLERKPIKIIYIRSWPPFTGLDLWALGQCKIRTLMKILNYGVTLTPCHAIF